MARSLIAFLQLRWLDRQRINAYAILLIVAAIPSFALFFQQATGAPGSDFLAFWSAGKLVIAGAASTVYDLDATFAVQAGVGRENVFAFVNPPPFLFIVAPLGLVDYPVGWGAWIVVTYLLWLAATRRADPARVRPIAAFPGALVAAWHAQTGLLTSAIQAAAATTLAKRPFVAGLWIGALIIKPHLAVLFPIALLASRNWTAIAGAAASVIGLMLAAWGVFGTETMLAYPQSWQVSQILLDSGGDDFFLRQATVYAALRVIAPAWIASAGQLAVSAAVIAVTWRVWSADGPLDGKLAMLMAATPLATPYLFNYDLPFLILPVVWLAGNQIGHAWERLMLAGFYVAPLACRSLAFPLGFNPTPLVTVLLLAAVLRRLKAR